MKYEMKCEVVGGVQMVMFRDFVVQKARSLNLCGLVRNKPEGSVEVVAQGDVDGLKKLVEYLWQGPLLARVRDVEVEWRDPTEEFLEFSISYN